MRKNIIIIVVFLFFSLLFLTGCADKVEENSKENKIVTSFYPIYVMTANIIQNVENIELKNMTDKTVGCLHNYILQTADLRKIENADIFIKNGFGVETFMNKVTHEYPELKIIDTSNAELGLIEDEEYEHEHEHEHEQTNEGHSHEVNGHVWNSLENYKKQVNYIAETLGNINPENAQNYNKNAKKYIEKINNIPTYKSLVKENVISCNEALEYLLKDANLNVIPVYTDHDESSLSAGKIAKIVDEAKEHNIKAIFIDINDDIKNAQIIANETGAKIVKLDAGLTGSLELNAYINAMTENFSKIKQVLEK